MSPGTRYPDAPALQRGDHLVGPRRCDGHDDRRGDEPVTVSERLMVMNAGSGFWHAEGALEDDLSLRMLLIFVRPHSRGKKRLRSPWSLGAGGCSG